MITDAQAIQQCLAGHLDAYWHIVERYQVQACGHTLALTGDREDALNATQEAFLDAFRALDGFDANRESYPWFYVLLRNWEQRRKCHQFQRSGDPQRSWQAALARGVTLLGTVCSCCGVEVCSPDVASHEIGDALVRDAGPL